MAWKEVYFNEYCPTCKFNKVADSEEPCRFCLYDAANWDSHRPTHYKEDKDAVKNNND